MNDTGACETPMRDHVARFWQLLETETVRIGVDQYQHGEPGFWNGWSSFPDDVAKAIVADRQALVEAQWLPIEKAPKDGSYVLISSGKYVDVARWSHGSFGGFDRDDELRWQPLPAPYALAEATKLSPDLKASQQPTVSE